MQQLQSFSGCVVTYNDEKYLSDCLSSLAFCDQLLVVDIGSTDDSVQISKSHGAEIFFHPHVQIVEQVYENIIERCQHDWIVFLDPDEVMPVGIENRLMEVIDKNENVGAIKIPWQFYFCGKPLYTTRWGRYDNSKIAVCHKERVKFQSFVHRGKMIRDGYDVVDLPRLSFEDCIKHYWIDSYQELFEKHSRYLSLEGESRYKAGDRFSWRKMLLSGIKGLYISLVRYRGLLGGFSGINLSFFWAWYIFGGWLSLRKYEREIETPRQ